MARSRIKSVVPINQMAAAITKEMAEWSQEIADAMKQAAIETADETVRDLRENSPKREVTGGAYAKSWTKTVMGQDRYTINQVVHNKRHYRLTHLLERGHANPTAITGMPRTPAYPHIGLAEARANDRLMEKARQYINDVD